MYFLIQEAEPAGIEAYLRVCKGFLMVSHAGADYCVAAHGDGFISWLAGNFNRLPDKVWPTIQEALAHPIGVESQPEPIYCPGCLRKMIPTLSGGVGYPTDACVRDTTTK